MPAPVSIDRIMETLRQFPNGATTAQLAPRLGMAPATISGRLSKLSLYGKIKARRVVTHEGGEHRRFYVWSAPHV